MIRALPVPTLVTETVRTLELRADEMDALDALNPSGQRLADLVQAGTLAVVDFQEEPIDEAALFIDYAAAIGDDGEAASLAIAATRGYAVATDDKRARSFARREVSHVPLVYTLDIVRKWEGDAAIPPEILGRVLADIEQEGSYRPGRSHPSFAWWLAARNSAGQ